MLSKLNNSSELLVKKAVDHTPRKQFVVSKKDTIVVGHSIPSKTIAQSILQNVTFHTSDKLLHIGTGSGYLPAIISLIVDSLVTVERIPALAKIASENFDKLGLNNIRIETGEGELGAPTDSPYDIIIVATPRVKVNDTIFNQLNEDGQIIAIEGGTRHSRPLVKYTRDAQANLLRTELTVLDFSANASNNLHELGIVDKETLELSKLLAIKNGVPIIEELRKLIQLEDTVLYRSIARQHNMVLGKIEDLFEEVNPKIFSLFSRAFLDHHRMIPLSDNGECLRVATTDPEASTHDFKAIYPNHIVEKILVTPASFQRLWSSLQLNSDNKSFNAQSIEIKKEVNRLDTEQTRLQSHLILVFEALLLDAISEGASDLHLELYGHQVRIRLRVDGELHDLKHYQLSMSDLVGLINVIKTRCELDISEHRLPQGGRTHLKVENVIYDLRVQTQPSLYGEHVVIRLLRQDSQLIKIDGLGFPKVIAAKYRRLLQEPAGLILVVGPTGSGKSTSLCAGLQMLANEPSRKVITIEDPIEYSIENIQQTRVRSDIGFNFSDAMRSFVRQDPDVILVGEIRDQETALEAMRASQTGHLVLSTLHSNDAIDALQRLFDLSVEPNSIASELNAVIAQRLAKRICEHCRQECEPDKELLFELFPQGAPKNFRCFEGKGCKHCNDRGTKGRIAVIEYLQVNDAIRHAISIRPPINELRSIALDVGLVTMRDSALDHIIQGIIPLSELPRLLPADRMAVESRYVAGRI